MTVERTAGEKWPPKAPMTLWRKEASLLSHRSGGEGSRGPGGIRDRLRPAQGHLTWVLVTGHLLVLGIQRPRRPGLFPQLHVWVPVRRGGDGRTEFTGRQTRRGAPGRQAPRRLQRVLELRAPSSALAGRRRTRQVPEGHREPARTSPCTGDQPKATHHLGKDDAPGLQRPGQARVPAPPFASWSPG